MSHDSGYQDPNVDVQALRAHLGATSERYPNLSEVQIGSVGSAEEVVKARRTVSGRTPAQRP